MDGRDEIIACSASGEIRGYLPAEEEQQGDLMDVDTNENTLQSLFNRKQELFAETVRQGDALLNRVQKLARALDI